jgi:hypothetical protein
MMQAFVLLLPCLTSSGATREKQIQLTDETIAGAVKVGVGRVWTWGDRLREWSVPALLSRELADGPWGEGGCAVDLDADGSKEFVGVRAAPGTLGDLQWLRLADGRVETVDTEADVHDCIEATLFGRRGILLIQRGIQVRFYERGDNGWQQRDVYSIYTPSYQGGLALADVDDDGRMDIFCGNYWIRSPERFELAWRLFAINTHSKEEQSATFRLHAVSAAEIVVSQAHLDDALIARFSRPPDPKQQWAEELLGSDTRIVQPRGLLVWHRMALVAERNGVASRLMLLGTDTVQVLGLIQPAAALIDVGTTRVFIAGATGIELWRID